MSSQMSSPKAAGGLGVTFEHKVQASFLVTMLVNGRYPCLPEGVTEFIRPQARQLGYMTDDVFVQLITKNGRTHRLLVQAKLTCSFTEGDDEFCSSITGAWDDFKNDALFDQERDYLLLVTGPVSAKAISHFRPLLNRAETSSTADEYYQKISREIFTSQTTRTYLDAIKSILAKHTGAEIDNNELWLFLKRFSWVTYDFDALNSQDLARVTGMLSLGLTVDSPKSADTIWSECLTLLADYNPEAGTLTRQDVLTRFLGCMRDGAVSVSPGIERLAEHSSSILDIVETMLRNGQHIDRQWLSKYLWESLTSAKKLLVAGVAGAGKSALLKGMLTTYGGRNPWLPV